MLLHPLEVDGFLVLFGPPHYNMDILHHCSSDFGVSFPLSPGCNWKWSTLIKIVFLTGEEGLKL